MVNLTPNVYAHWKLNENAGNICTDSSVNGRDGTRVNMEDADWVAGKLNNCLRFDGVNEYVNCQNIAGFERTDSFSFELWFKTSTADKYLFSKQISGGTYRGYLLWLDGSGRVNFGLTSTWATGNRLQVHAATVGLSDNTWHHLIVTYDGSSVVAGIHIYIDNVNEGLTPLANNLTATIQNAERCQISGRALATFWNGDIDEIVIYDKELSSEEVTFRWNSGTGTEDMVSIPPTAPSNPDPGDTATGIAYDQNLDWNCPDADTYDIYLGTGSPPPLVESNHPSSDWVIPFNLDSCT